MCICKQLFSHEVVLAFLHNHDLKCVLINRKFTSFFAAILKRQAQSALIRLNTVLSRAPPGVAFA